MIHTDGNPTIACRAISAPSRAVAPGLDLPIAAPTIAEDSLLQMDRFEGFRAAFAHAAAEPSAAVALSRITPEQAYSLFAALKQGEEAAR